MTTPTGYSLALWGILIIIITLVIQSLVAAFAKARQPGAVPGKMNPDISHESFVFRSNRAIANSLENASIMLATAFLALFVGADTHWTGKYIMIFAIARIVHMILYYTIATEKNPSPRSFFYLIGLVANIALIGLIAITLV